MGVAGFFFFTPIRYHDPVLWVWLDFFFHPYKVPIRYHDPVLWVWLDFFFHPYKVPRSCFVGVAGFFFTPIRYHDPVLWVWLDFFFPPVLWVWYHDPVFVGDFFFHPYGTTTILFCGCGWIFFSPL